MRLSCTFFIIGLFLFLVPTRAVACFCSPPWGGNFCENVDTSYHNVALVRITDSISFELRRIEVLDVIYGTIAGSTDKLFGENGGNCGEWLGQFSVEDTLLVALTPWINTSDTLAYLGGCRTLFARYQNNALNLGGTLGWVDYAEFRDAPELCFDLFVSTQNAERVLPEVELFPNPTTQFLHFRTAGATIREIEIYSVTGQQLNHQYISAASGKVAVEAFSPGVYLARITTDRGVVTKRFVRS